MIARLFGFPEENQRNQIIILIEIVLVFFVVGAVVIVVALTARTPVVHHRNGSTMIEQKGDQFRTKGFRRAAEDQQRSAPVSLRTSKYHR